jgi:tetratricopeptide (TPR) repeat protein
MRMRILVEKYNLVFKTLTDDLGGHPAQTKGNCTCQKNTPRLASRFIYPSLADAYRYVHSWPASMTEKDKPLSGESRNNTDPCQSKDDIDDVSIQEMRDTAAQRLAVQDYATAESMLQEVLKRSEDKYGLAFSWRDKTMEQHATACWELGKWEQADEILDQQFKGRTKLMNTLARRSVDNGKRESAERLISKHFDGKEAIMEMLVDSYLRDKKWKKARRILIELLQNETNQTVRLERMHTLATVCFTLKEYGKAEGWCLKALIGRQDSQKFYESVTLLAQIYNADANVPASAYEAVLADLSPGLHGIPQTL